jgi:chromosome segregation ATPase
MAGNCNHKCEVSQSDISSLRSELSALRNESLSQKTEIHQLKLQNKEQDKINKATAEFIKLQTELNKEVKKDLKYLNLEVAIIKEMLEKLNYRVGKLEKAISEAIKLALKHLESYSQAPKSDYVVLNSIQTITAENMASVIAALQSKEEKKSKS